MNEKWQIKPSRALGGRPLLRVYAKHDPYWDTGHLGRVLNEMRELGPPTIRVVEHRGDYVALEASHRLCAAHHLGLVPTLDVVEPDRLDAAGEDFLSRVVAVLPHYSWIL